MRWSGFALEIDLRLPAQALATSQCLLLPLAALDQPRKADILPYLGRNSGISRAPQMGSFGNLDPKRESALARSRGSIVIEFQKN